jgi:hypothetical protein
MAAAGGLLRMTRNLNNQGTLLQAILNNSGLLRVAAAVLRAIELHKSGVYCAFDQLQIAATASLWQHR